MYWHRGAANAKGGELLAITPQSIRNSAYTHTQNLHHPSAVRLHGGCRRSCQRRCNSACQSRCYSAAVRQPAPVGTNEEVGACTSIVRVSEFRCTTLTLPPTPEVARPVHQALPPHRRNPTPYGRTVSSAADQAARIDRKSLSGSGGSSTMTRKGGNDFVTTKLR
jgi:hypothetical protein